MGSLSGSNIGLIVFSKITISLKYQVYRYKRVLFVLERLSFSLMIFFVHNISAIPSPAFLWCIYWGIDSVNCPLWSFIQIQRIFSCYALVMSLMFFYLFSYVFFDFINFCLSLFIFLIYSFYLYLFLFFFIRSSQNCQTQTKPYLNWFKSPN